MPLGAQIADTQIQCFCFGIVAARNTLSGQEIMQIMEIDTEGFCTSLARNFGNSVDN